MEVYVLDDRLRRIEVIDLFESCIWTDRFALSGDVELIVEDNQNFRRLLTEGTILACNMSDRIMEIQTVERTQDDQGRKMIKVKAVSAEEFYLNNRVALKAPYNEKVQDWSFYGPPAWIARQLFNSICVEGSVSGWDRLPYYVAGNMYRKDTIAEPATNIHYNVKPGSLYDNLTDICSSYDLGFRITRNQDWSELRFNIYAGNDRTTHQIGLPAIVFSSAMNNLSNINEFESSADYKNVAMVAHKDASTLVVVYSPNYVEDTTGFSRRVLYVDGNSIDSNLVGNDRIDALRDLGRQELAKLGRLAAFDGEVSQFGSYEAGVDYFLGDLVELQSETGASSILRVSELIYTSDAQGDRAYPTLSINKYVTPRSWQSWDYTQEWSGATVEWNNA